MAMEKYNLIALFKKLWVEKVNTSETLREW